MSFEQARIRARRRTAGLVSHGASGKRAPRARALYGGVTGALQAGCGSGASLTRLERRLAPKAARWEAYACCSAKSQARSDISAALRTWPRSGTVAPGRERRDGVRAVGVLAAKVAAGARGGGRRLRRGPLGLRRRLVGSGGFHPLPTPGPRGSLPRTDFARGSTDHRRRMNCNHTT